MSRNCVMSKLLECVCRTLHRRWKISFPHRISCATLLTTCCGTRSRATWRSPPTSRFFRGCGRTVWSPGYITCWTCHGPRRDSGENSFFFILEMYIWYLCIFIRNVFLSVFFLYYFVHCSRRQLEALVGGMKDAIHQHSWPSHITEPIEECAVCLEKCVTEKFRLVCGHWFCHSCQIKWLKLSNKCPLCRSIIFWDREEDPDHVDPKLQALQDLLEDSDLDDSDLDLDNPNDPNWDESLM